MIRVYPKQSLIDYKNRKFKFLYDKLKLSSEEIEKTGVSTSNDRIKNQFVDTS